MVSFTFIQLNLLRALSNCHSSLPYPDYDKSSNDTIIMYTLKRTRKMHTPFWCTSLRAL